MHSFAYEGRGVYFLSVETHAWLRQIFPNKVSQFLKECLSYNSYNIISVEIRFEEDLRIYVNIVNISVQEKSEIKAMMSLLRKYDWISNKTN